MKNSRKLLMLATILAGFGMQSSAQVTTLREVKVVASTYKYLNAADNKEMAPAVQMLEEKAANYDVKKSEFYNEDYDGYSISFYIPDGNILAAYDENGKLIRTAEKYKDTKLPPAVRDAVAQRFPNWHISKNVYQVNYYESKGQADKTFKIVLENGDKRMKLKVNEKGEFI